MPSAANVFSLLAALIASVGAASAIIVGLSAWLGKVWATRIADRERATMAQDLEQYRHQLSELATQQQDALTRKRDVYSELAASMRVFLGDSEPANDQQKREFLKAYDRACLWASEEVAEAIGKLLVHGNSYDLASPA